MNHMGDRSLPNHSVIQAHVGIHLLTIPQHGNIQHHAFLNGECPALQALQSLQRIDLKLRKEAQSAHVDSQHRQLVQRRQLCKMQNRSVAAQCDDEACSL